MAYSSLETSYYEKNGKTLEEAMREAVPKCGSVREAVLRVGISEISLRKYAKEYKINFKKAPRQAFKLY